MWCFLCKLNTSGAVGRDLCVPGQREGRRLLEPGTGLRSRCCLYPAFLWSSHREPGRVKDVSRVFSILEYGTQAQTKLATGEMG